MWPVYALSPGQANDDLIDYKITWGQKHWTDSTKKLIEKLYIVVLKILLQRPKSRVEDSGWIQITFIDNKNLLTQIGTISIEVYKKEATKYLT